MALGCFVHAGIVSSSSTSSSTHTSSVSESGAYRHRTGPCIEHGVNSAPRIPHPTPHLCTHNSLRGMGGGGSPFSFILCIDGSCFLGFRVRLQIDAVWTLIYRQEIEFRQRHKVLSSIHVALSEHWSAFYPNNERYGDRTVS